MSYRDLRNFTEMMQELGYPRLISMENFRTPNFPLVAEILIWLIKRFDPDTDISFETNTEDQRVALIRAVAQILIQKANLKLNTKKLYQANGYAVKEMLKVTSLLYNSLKAADLKNKEIENEPEVSIVATILKAHELKHSSQLVYDIVSSGASLFHLLEKEVELRELRNYRASWHMEMSQVEQAVKDSIKDVSNEIENTKQSIDSIMLNKTTLDTKIEKRKSDLDRNNKRLQTLKKIRPAFMEEFEKLEEQLSELYNEYVLKYRNMSYLESISEQTEQKRIDEKQVAKAITRKLIEELKQDEESEEIFSEGIEETNSKPAVKHPESSKNIMTKGSYVQQQKQAKVFGSMAGNFNNSESLDDSDSDLLLDGDITEDDYIEVDNTTRGFSDDDF